MLTSISIVLVCLAACGGEAGPTPNIPTVTATPVSASPSAQPAPARAAATRPLVTASPAVTKPPATATEQPTATAPPESDTENAAAVRRIVRDYWAAFNDYDAERALNFLEPGYRALEEEPIRRDIRRMRLFRVKLEVSEETPPTRNANGDYETYLAVATPIDTRRLLMVFQRLDGHWRIAFSGEVE